MIRQLLIASAASLALTAPLSAEPGGKGKGSNHGPSAKADHRGGQASSMKSERRGGQQRQAARAERGGGQKMRVAQVERGRDKARDDRGRGRSVEMRQERQVRVDRAPKRQEMRMRGNDRALERMADRGRGNAVERMADRGRGNDGFRGRSDYRDYDGVKIRDADRFRTRFADSRILGTIGFCPPGLAMKNNGCLPPGQAKKMVGNLVPSAIRSSLLPVDLRDYWRDNDDYYYRYNDGYLYRVNRDSNLIASLLPLFGGGYALGQPFPYQSSAYYMPSYYQPFYQDTADMWYRYDNGYVYGIDPYTGMIDNIIPTYDYGYGVGQMLPASYSYYNLPYPYRSYYTDNDDYYYRYAPGAIYQVDRDTQLISAVASLLTGGFGVGQQLPLGYDAYNVPYAYRSQYYDTADNWYRYNNGYIYQVDPTTRLITAVIDAIV